MRSSSRHRHRSSRPCNSGGTGGQLRLCRLSGHHRCSLRCLEVTPARLQRSRKPWLCSASAALRYRSLHLQHRNAFPCRHHGTADAAHQLLEIPPFAVRRSIGRHESRGTRRLRSGYVPAIGRGIAPHQYIASHFIRSVTARLAMRHP